jgi:hypothetical protein
MEQIADDERTWRARAAEARALAEMSNHPETKCTLLEIAADYDRLANAARDRSQRSSPGS